MDNPIPPVASLFDFSGKVVLVTGSSQGIGRGIALRFAEAGAAVAVHYHTRAAAAEEVVRAIQQRGRASQAFGADVTKGGDAARLVEEVANQLGSLDVLVNNAGTYPVSSILEMHESEWDQVISSNLRSVHLCTQAAARQMITQGSGGSIINIASVEGVCPAQGHSHYNSAKAGVIMYTRSAARELGSSGIRVNAVSPGLIWRPKIEEAIPDFVDRWTESNPLGRLGFPDDIADACLFLASPAARWITGVNLPVDGGYLAG